MRADRPVCFRPPPGALAPASEPVLPLRLADRHAAALAELLQLLACGEESAVLVFDRLSRGSVTAQQALSAIARDERSHERLLRQLRGAAPEPANDTALRHALLRFFHEMSHAAPGLHFASIVALDSAVCIILGRLLARGRPLACDAAAAGVLGRIRRDEARHVRLAREFARAWAPPCDAVAAAQRTRHGLVGLLSRRAACFETLDVDAPALLRRLARVPAGLVT